MEQKQRATAPAVKVQIHFAQQGISFFEALKRILKSKR